MSGPVAALPQAGVVWVATLPVQAALCAYDPAPAAVALGTVVGLAGIVLVATGRTAAGDVGDVLAATGAWVVSTAAWPGGWAYGAPLVVLVLVLVRRSQRTSTSGLS